MNREELLKSTMREQQHDAKEANLCPLEIVPIDLLTVFVGKNVGRYKIFGFEMSKDQDGICWWSAVFTGNGVMLESDLLAKGFIRAFNGSPSRCRIRTATPEEREAYLTA